MSTIGTLVMTAAATVGAVALAKKIQKRVKRARDLARGPDGQGPVLDLEVDETSGVWRDTSQRRQS